MAETIFVMVEIVWQPLALWRKLFCYGEKQFTSAILWREFFNLLRQYRSVIRIIVADSIWR
jgi:hypothetical protein